MPRRRDDRIFQPAYVEKLHALPVEELRRRKAECEELEAELSYARRLLQGKLDILHHEMERRAAGGERGFDDLITALPSILAEGTSASIGRLPRILLPRQLERQRRDVERLVSDATLAQIDALSNEDLGAFVEQLSEAERETSQRRRRVQERMDAVSAEIVRRYRDGEVDPTVLLRTHQ